MRQLNELVRPNIWDLKAYSSARSEYKNSTGIFLDANENPFGSLNRYPDPQQSKLKKCLSKLWSLPESQMFIGNGSDEIIDLCYRIFCTPGIDSAVTFSPGYGMYETLANINNVQLKKIPLDESFQINLTLMGPYLNDKLVKMIIICSPNNPTGNLLNGIDQILSDFDGIVLVDEAYIDFSESESWAYRLCKYPNLIVSRTLSKAMGLAAARVGIAHASSDIIGLLNKVKAPYNISTLNENAAMQALEDEVVVQRQKSIIVSERKRMAERLCDFEFVKKVYPSDANFLLVEVSDANRLYTDLIGMGIVTRNRNNEVKNCIRITIGLPEENDILLSALTTLDQTPIRN